ncbi:MAG: hypothetical protein N3G77_07955, partial [Nitrososphaeria archaeon]|nr:hypothetical protein [Nitrososphaeria archaeon]
EDSIGLPVDVIPLNEASPKLLLKIISNGFVITIKDMGLLIKLIKIALTEVMDIELKLKFMHGSKETS